MVNNSNSIQTRPRCGIGKRPQRPKRGVLSCRVLGMGVRFDFRSGRLLDTKIKQCRFPRVVPRFREAATAKTSQVRRLSEHQKITSPIDRADDTRDTGSTIGSDEETGALKSERGVRDKYERTDEKHALDTTHHASSARPRR